MYYECCKIVGVKPGSDVISIKKAYREKAKMLHPDINPSPKSHMQFIVLQKAFEYLIKFEAVRKDLYRTKSGGQAQYTGKTRSNSHSDTRTNPSQSQKKEEYEFLNFTFGKIIFIFFHLLFIATGLFMIIRPFFALIQTGISEDQNPASSLATLIFSIIFGILILRVFLYSSVKLFKHN